MLVSSVLIVTERIQSLTGLQNLIVKNGINQIYSSNTVRETLDTAARECTTLIVIESDLPDGSAIDILRRIRADIFLARVPVILVRKPTKEEIAECVKLKVSAILPKPYEINALADKIKSCLDALRGVSPYAVPLDPKTTTAKIAMPATVIGKSGQHLICQSALVTGIGNRLSIRPKDPTLAPVLAAASGHGTANQQWFPVADMIGKGRLWIDALKNATSEDKKSKKIVLLESNKDRATQICKLTATQSIETLIADNLQKCISMHQQDPKLALLMMEAPTGIAALPLEKYLSSLVQRPQQIIATSVANPQPKPGVTWLKKPFTLDTLMQKLQHATQPAVTEPQLQLKIGCEYLLSASVESFDENGLTLLLPFEALPEFTLKVTHPLLSAAGYIGEGQLIPMGIVDATHWRACYRPAEMSKKNWRALLPKLIQQAPQT